MSGVSEQDYILSNGFAEKMGNWAISRYFSIFILDVLRNSYDRATIFSSVTRFINKLFQKMSVFVSKCCPLHS